ncbi:hypothetical protein [Salinibacter ruber]|uniref:hypothetical protein n=1 Tax=Salinibacter ruber TaxID=146919 RepID=UPI0021694FC1|nr:hypothetical protein [Salinibacter ruber]MCS4221262.1 hypothetical protein [Salinibacter ruber]
MVTRLLSLQILGQHSLANWAMSQVAVLLLVSGTLILGITPEAASGQEFGRANDIKTNAAYFFYGQAGGATIQVNLLGVRASGVYEVPDSTDLGKVLSLAGGMNLRPRTEEQKRPEVTIRLYRGGQIGGDPAFEALLREILRGKRDVPVLRENDTITVDVVRPSTFTFSQGLSIVSTLASIGLLLDRVLNR